MQKNLWKASFSSSFIPAFPCPDCKIGKLVRAKREDYADRRPKNPSWEDYEQDPSAFPSRFSLFLTCARCAEIVVVSGMVHEVPGDDGNGGVEWNDHLAPEHMWPAPPIIETKQLPAEVTGELERSFGYYWNDPGTCAARMRTSLERLLDHFKVRTITVVTDRSGKRRRKRLDLSSRIDNFAKKIRSREYSDLLHALRTVGNVGTHGTKEVTKANLLDAYKLYEHAVERLFEDKSESIKETIKRLSRLR